MLRSVASKVAWVGRTASMVFGLTLVLALVLGLATMALAAVPGDPFKLGRVNSVNKLTTLVGTVTSPMLRVENKGTGTALNLKVRQGKPPLTTNSTGRVPRLNSDMVDGKHASAFLPRNGKAADADKLDGQEGAAFLQASTPTYKVWVSKTGTEGFTSATRVACDMGDKVLSGGVFGINPGHSVFVASEPAPVVGDPRGTPFRAWDVWWFNEENPDSGTTGDLVAAIAYCADFGTPHSTS